MRLLIFLFLIISTSAVGQQLDTLIQFDFKSAATEIQLASDGRLVILANEGSSTSDAYYHRDGFLSKYTQDGTLIWEQSLGFGSSEFSSMAVDPYGSIYVAFYESNFKMKKFDRDGILLWEKSVPVFSTGNFRITPDVLYADEEYLYMGAHYFGDGYFELDTLDKNNKGPLCLLQYDHDGDARWIRYLQATSGQFTGIDSDEEHVYFSTTTFNEISIDTFSYRGSGRGGAVGKLTNTGKTVWLRPFAGVDFGHLCNGMMLDKFSNVYAIGNLPASTTLTKYDKNGNVLWVNTTPSTSGAIGGARWNSIYVDDFGEAYTAGYFSGTVNFGINILNGTDQYKGDFIFAKYNDKGEMLWVKSIPGEGRDDFFSMTGFQNTIFMAGYNKGVLGSQSIPFENYLSVLKYEDNEGADLTFYNQEYSLFPNPNTGLFCVYLNDNFQEEVRVSVYDMLGRAIYDRHYDGLPIGQPFVTIDLPDSVVPGHYVLNVEDGEKNKAFIFAVY